MKSRFSSYIWLFFGVVALSTSAIFVKLADAPAAIVAFYRMFFAALILLPFLIAKPKELFTLSRKQWMFGVASGLLLAIHYVLWFESLNYTSIASSTVIVTLSPLFAISGGIIFFKERFSKGAILGCFIAIIGSFIIGWQDFQISGMALYGDILAFIAAGIITGYFMIGQHLRKTLSLVPYSIIAYGSSTIFLFLFSWQQQYSFTDYSGETWIYLFALAFIATILGHTIFNWLIKWLSTSIISMSILGETVGTIILAFIIFGEIITIQQGFGILLILIGLALFLLQDRNMLK